VKTFEQQENEWRRALVDAPVINRGEWQAQTGLPDNMRTPELRHVQLQIQLPELPHELIEQVNPNLPWAEDHFQERVSGKPLNPPPSHEWWPYQQGGNSNHRDQVGTFSHTYPERFWPKFAPMDDFAGEQHRVIQNHGIRYQYGDLYDLMDLLARNPYTRQAYLPIWFPEDLQAAVRKHRVPCTLGYHFLMDDKGRLDITYHIRSCDFQRHFRDDVYMAGRLCQWVVSYLNDNLDEGNEPWTPGTLVMNIASLHCFEGDRPMMFQQIKEANQKVAARMMNAF
jgi:Thymidylate synthase